MGCFPACFGHWKSMKNIQHLPLSPSHEKGATLLAAITEPLKEEEISNLIKLVSESEAKSDEKINVKERKEAVFNHSNTEKCTNEPVSSNNDKLVENENEEVEKKREICKDDNGLESNLEKGIDGHKDDNSNEEIFGDCCCQSQEEEEETSESLFSLSIDSRRRVYAADQIGEKEVTSSLKPIENSSQKIDQPSFKNGDYDEEDEDKENAEEPVVIKQSFDQSKQQQQQHIRRDSETAVSLSSWLVESSEKSPQQKGIINISVGDDSPESENNYGDRRILGAITPNCINADNADNQVGIGTVGKYWQRNV